MFLFFSAAKHLISRNQAEFLMVWSGLEQINQERKSIFDQFQKAVQRVFLNKL